MDERGPQASPPPPMELLLLELPPPPLPVELLLLELPPPPLPVELLHPRRLPFTGPRRLHDGGARTTQEIAITNMIEIGANSTSGRARA
ncbi:hypothetical protein [Sorangium sp. So ce388]|uniref:hypothetical protein n=1 Tax=Sorangium sp. So ce388 TaxID=3133309 RepID=UPI003F5B71C7